MTPRILRSLVVLVLMSSATLAHAFVDPPTVSPMNALVGQTIYVSVRAGMCDAIVYDPAYPKITQTESAIRVLIETAHADAPIFCIYNPPGTAAFSIGSYPAGSYTIQVDRHYLPFIGPEVIEAIGTLSFTVAEPTSLPALTLPSLLMLALLLAIAAWWHRRHVSAPVRLSIRSIV